jgi:transposase
MPRTESLAPLRPTAGCRTTSFFGYGQASIATSRRRRRVKTDKIDGEALTRTLLAFKRGEPRVCAMVRAPYHEDEDRRRICRERKVLIAGG